MEGRSQHMCTWAGSTNPVSWPSCSPIDDVKAKSPTFLHHVSEMNVELRSSSSNVEGLDRRAVFDYLEWCARKMGSRVRLARSTPAKDT